LDTYAIDGGSPLTMDCELYEGFNIIIFYVQKDSTTMVPTLLLVGNTSLSETWDENFIRRKKRQLTNED
jgi:hypothetical protein